MFFANFVFDLKLKMVSTNDIQLLHISGKAAQYHTIIKILASQNYSNRLLDLILLSWMWSLYWSAVVKKELSRKVSLGM